VTQARNDVRQAAAFARRLVCRALTVVGGVAAGTALAWALSSATASADTPADVPVAVQEIAAPVVEPVEQTADTLARPLQDPPPPPKAITDLGQKVKDTADQFRGETLPALPSCTTACGDRHDYLGDVFGRSDLPTAPAPVPAAAAAAPGVAVDALVPGSAKDRASADGMSRRGSPEPALPALPDLPNWPAPWSPTPISIPTTGNLGSTGNSTDSHLFAALPWQARGVDLVAGGVAAASDSATVGRIGAQPGVAPD
jgi:hypothetical protein